MENLLYSNSSVFETLLKFNGFAVFIFIASIVIDIIIIRASVKIANNKGRNGAAWGWTAFFFGLIALIIVVCLPDISYVSTKKTSTYSWSCPFCGKLNYGQHSICNGCGRARDGVSSQKKETIWYCPKCGTSNSCNAINCKNCFTKKPY